MDKGLELYSSEKLIEAIIEGFRRKKGVEIVNLNLTCIENSQCNNYIICHGKSTTQVEALARSVEETVQEEIGEKAWHRDGYRNAQWILLDYMDVMVHVFQEEYRKHYDIESLWADAVVTTYQSENI